MKIVVLINRLSENPLPDELDVLDQAEVVQKSLKELGHESEIVQMDMNLDLAEKTILAAKPDFVFNLFEGITGKTDMLYVAAGLLQNMKIPYSGCSVESIFITGDKVLTKKILRLNNIPTAKWFDASQMHLLKNGEKYIIKPTSEDASLGITEKSVFVAPKDNLIDEYRKNYGNKFFAEQFIDGREFNISVIGTPKGAKMLSPAEINFVDFPEDKPKIVSYAAKWDEDTFECKNTVRTFYFKSEDATLLKKIEQIVLETWKVFDLRGYARVDLRVSKNNEPFVLEVNANPCISADSGFYAAALKTGFTFTQIIDFVIKDTLKNEHK